MRTVKHVGVIDIGKTNVKVAVVDVESGVEMGVMTRPNKVLAGPPYPHYDIDGHWDFILASLQELHQSLRIDALSVSTHGASVVLLGADGELAAPTLDYEFDGPDDLAADYDAIRPEFSETGSPRLGMGLNVGAQLFWQLQTDPTLKDRIATVLTYPQYWAFRLTGKLSNEVTSLGCHTDLWNPIERKYSSLVGTLGLANKMAPVKSATKCLCYLRSAVAAETGLPLDAPVACGIHDSNASLYPHLLKRTTPFSVVSTGTWVISLAIDGRDVELDPGRDTLINVNALGDPVPSARFMGGREFDLVMGGRTHHFDECDIADVLAQEIMLFPAVDPRSGPFQGREHSWSIEQSDLSDGQRYVALSFYLALVTAECLNMIGAEGPVVVEGPFVQNTLYLDMLKAVTGRPVESTDGSMTGTSIGAALLVERGEKHASHAENHIHPTADNEPGLASYAARWKTLLEA
ncbi:FGGY-family carbohydrate kinase [Roseibium algae]|uniref:FGGY-family carbohydrate kinase n=1 Tax=Roseibium algae TaxID=3123038 RepID=A0ABU8TFA3_9HYPH